MIELVKKYKGPLVFVLKFVAFYFIGNIAYGMFIHSFYPSPDPLTSVVAHQTCSILNLLGYEVNTALDMVNPNVHLSLGNRTVITVFEGCNGLNVLILYCAFLFAFPFKGKRMLKFLLLGIVVIHVMNILRVGGLFLIAEHWEIYFYFFHKYFFTGIIYLAVLSLWYLWVKNT